MLPSMVVGKIKISLIRKEEIIKKSKKGKENGREISGLQCVQDS